MTIDQLTDISVPLHVSLPKKKGDFGPLIQDSRKVTPGSVFIAMRGTEVDGHIFMDDAIEKGAEVVICEESYYTEKDVCIIEVENTRAIFGKLAQAFAGNPAHKLKVVGITGTNGKTTTTTLIYNILSRMGKKAALLGTVAKYIQGEEFDSKLTTADPLELAEDMKKMVEMDTEYMVMEVSSHALHQGRVKGIDFDVTAFTNLSHDHLDYHGSFEEYAKAKKLLFDDLKGDAIAVINTDDEYGSFMVEDSIATVYDFGFIGDSLYECTLISNDADGLIVNVEDTTISSPLVGLFNAYNLVTAFLVCKALDLPADEVVQALGESKGAAGRMESIKVDTCPYVIVDYAHSPDALRNVLETLKSLKADHQQLWVVFGCGGNRDAAKRPEMARISETLAERVVVTSDNPRNEEPEDIIKDIMAGFVTPNSVQAITDRAEAIHFAIEHATPSDIILIAGKGHEDYQEVKGERIHFDDREIASEALHRRAGTNSEEEG
jgi:UDP-N-acetylmuramoyl-L-alanyl-D-glutamate--2,6-diaminopimelate ligase